MAVSQYRISVSMTSIVAGVWGLFGSFAIEGLDFRAAFNRYGCWPWKVPSSVAKTVPEAGPLGYAVAELIRLIIGAGLAMAAVATGQVSGPLGAIGIGVAAPTIVGQLTRFVPLKSTGVSRSMADRPAEPPPILLPAQRPGSDSAERSTIADSGG